MHMSEQRTPEDRATENEQICEKLLGWEKVPPSPPLPGIEFAYWHRPWFSPSGERIGSLDESTPSFTTWAEAGLILEAWTASNNDYDIEGTSTEHGLKISARLRQIKGISYVGDFVGFGETAPAAIRAAALAYIRSQS